MKTNQLIKQSTLFIIAFTAFGLSIIVALNLADYEINTHISAIGAFIQLFISIAGLLVLPVFMFSLFLRIISIALQAPVKRKNTSLDTIAS